jgi:hypothetical protein
MGPIFVPIKDSFTNIFNWTEVSTLKFLGEYLWSGICTELYIPHWEIFGSWLKMHFGKHAL